MEGVLTPGGGLILGSLVGLLRNGGGGGGGDFVGISRRLTRVV